MPVAPNVFNRICKAQVEPELGLVFGYAIVCKQRNAETGEFDPYFDRDASGPDHISEVEMLKGATEFMLQSREIDENHSVDAAPGSVVFAFPMTVEMAKSLGITIEKSGLLIGMKPEDPAVLEKFRDGTYTGFSIGGTATRVKAGAAT